MKTAPEKTPQSPGTPDNAAGQQAAVVGGGNVETAQTPVSPAKPGKLTYADMNTLDPVRLARFPYDAGNVDILRVDYILSVLGHLENPRDRLERRQYVEGYLAALSTAQRTIRAEFGVDLGRISGRRSDELGERVFREVRIVR